MGSLLRRRASSDEIVGSLRDWRRELGVRPDDSADEAAGSKIGAWYGWVVGEFAEDDSFLESAD